MHQKIDPFDKFMDQALDGAVLKAERDADYKEYRKLLRVASSALTRARGLQKKWQFKK